MGLTSIEPIRIREPGMSLVIEAASGPFCTHRQAIITREYCKYVCHHTLCPERSKRRNVIHHIFQGETHQGPIPPRSAFLRGNPHLDPSEDEAKIAGAFSSDVRDFS
jgi:hypothetical protein